MRMWRWLRPTSPGKRTVGCRPKRYLEVDALLRTPWTKSAVAYKRLSPSDLAGMERGERHIQDVYASGA
jgi:hypothetical protein